jgi:hypothetical protein
VRTDTHIRGITKDATIVGAVNLTGSGGIILDSITITGSRGTGLNIETTGKVSLRRVVVTQNGGDGISILDVGALSLHQVAVTKNGRSGIVVANNQALRGVADSHAFQFWIQANSGNGIECLAGVDVAPTVACAAGKDCRSLIMASGNGKDVERCPFKTCAEAGISCPDVAVPFMDADFTTKLPVVPTR